MFSYMCTMYSGSTFPLFLSGTFWPTPPPYNYLSLLALVLFCPILFNQGHLSLDLPSDSGGQPCFLPPPRICGLPTDPQHVTKSLFRADCQEGLTSVSTPAAGEYMVPKPTSCSFPVLFPILRLPHSFCPLLLSVP